MSKQTRYTQLAGSAPAARGCGSVNAWYLAMPWLLLTACDGDAAPATLHAIDVDTVQLTERTLPAAQSSVRAIDVDILPGRYPNRLRAHADREVAVAILSPQWPELPYRLSQVALADAGDSAVRVAALGPALQRDVNGDGRRDLVFAFSRSELERRELLTASTTRLALVARTDDGRELVGIDRIFLDQTPILRLPLPTGRAAVGTRPLAFVDPTRTGPDGHERTLVVRVWYPAWATPAQPAPYFLDPRESTANEDEPNRFDSVHASSVVDAPWARAGRRQPLVVLSTGWGVALTFYTTLAEQLASEGYFVFGIEHPGGSGNVVLPDGTVVPFDANLPTVELVEEWARDIAAIASAAVDADSAIGDFAEQIDPARVGALGHSLGGAAAVLAAGHVASIRAAINLDGAFWGEALTSGPTQPVLFMGSEGHLAIDTVQQFFAHARGRVYAVEVAGSAHMNYSDYTFWYPFGLLLDPTLSAADFNVGEIAAPRMREIVSSYVTAFFAETLRGQRSPLLHGDQQPFPEAPSVTIH